MNRSLRQSNIELIRIVAIVFIIAHHLLVHGMNIWEDVSWRMYPIEFLDAVFFIGVNLFVLISGYCGIKFRWKKLFSIWLQCALVGSLAYFIHLYLDNANFGRSFLYNTIFSISKAPGTWYVTVYVFLMFLSPLINKSLENMTKKQVLWSIGAFAIISTYFGWFWGHEVNKDGYNLINFIWVYVIGFYLKNHWNTERYKPYLYLFVGIACSILHSVLFVSCREYVAWTYNNPFVVVSAIAFFLFMISFQFKSQLVNGIAASTLVVYLFHENSYVSSWLYGFNSWYSLDVWRFVVAVFLVYFSGILVDMIVRKCIANNILKYFYPYLSKYGKQILSIKSSIW